MKELTAVIEAILFASGDRITSARLADILGIDSKACKEAFKLLQYDLENSKRGVRVREIENGFQMHTAPENQKYIDLLHDYRQKQGLSQACYEVLSVIAYKQPVTRIQIEKIRGTASDSALTRLVEKGLIRASGRLDAPGRPILYETTINFLRTFGLASTKDLPVIDIIDTPILSSFNSSENES
jgi:segregation and condensation protein B